MNNYDDSCIHSEGELSIFWPRTFCQCFWVMELELFLYSAHPHTKHSLVHAHLNGNDEKLSLLNWACSPDRVHILVDWDTLHKYTVSTRIQFYLCPIMSMRKAWTIYTRRGWSKCTYNCCLPAVLLVYTVRFSLITASLRFSLFDGMFMCPLNENVPIEISCTLHKITVDKSTQIEIQMYTDVCYSCQHNA